MKDKLPLNQSREDRFKVSLVQSVLYNSKFSKLLIYNYFMSYLLLFITRVSRSPGADFGNIGRYSNFPPHTKAKRNPISKHMSHFPMTLRY